MVFSKSDKRIPEILAQVRRLASGDFSKFLSISENYDDIDGISAGLNQLCDALQARVSLLQKREERLENMLKIFGRYLDNNFREPLPVLENGGEIDKLAAGLNNLVKDLSGDKRLRLQKLQKSNDGQTNDPYEF